MSSGQVQQTDGAYEKAGERTTARVEFMAAIARTATSVFDSLERDVLPVFIERRSQYLVPRSWELPDADDQFDLDYPDSFEAELVPPFLRWAGTHYLAGPNGTADAEKLAEPFRLSLFFGVDSTPALSLLAFVFRVAMATLEKWAAEGGRGPEPAWELSKVITEGSVDCGPLAFEVSWDVGRESEPAFRARVQAKLQQNLDEYSAGISRLAQPRPDGEQASKEWRVFLKMLSPEARQAVEKAACRKPQLAKIPYRYSPRHFDWLVQYQLLGKSKNAIAAGLGGKDESRRVVGAGVNGAAKMVFGPNFKTWLRRPRPGRPRQTRSQ